MTVNVDPGKCIGCGACIVECPAEALDLIDGIAVADPAKCKDNGSCVEVCPSNALSLHRPDKAVEKSENLEAVPNKNVPPEGGYKMEFTKDEPMPDPVQDYAGDNPRKIISTEEAKTADLKAWSGVWVVIEYNHGEIAPVSWELMGEGRKLADEVGCELAGVLCGSQVEHVIQEAFEFGAEKVFVIDDPVLKDSRFSGSQLWNCG
ncbi:MAG: 4Fe-4S binding protein [Peptococcaceae bacterium]|nr:4Fe-4S binding protein [Peptococcaceae bacterium]